MTLNTKLQVNKVQDGQVLGKSSHETTFVIVVKNGFFPRDKMATDKKLLTTKLDEDNDDRRKEISALKANIQKEREELRGQVKHSATIKEHWNFSNSTFVTRLITCHDRVCGRKNVLNQ